MPSNLVPSMPTGVHLVSVDGSPARVRRMTVVRSRDRTSVPISAVLTALTVLRGHATDAARVFHGKGDAGARPVGQCIGGSRHSGCALTRDLAGSISARYLLRRAHVSTGRGSPTEVELSPSRLPYLKFQSRELRVFSESWPFLLDETPPLRQGEIEVSVYLSMQRVRFSSPDAYEKFKLVFSDTRNHLMQLPGFLHLT